MSKMVRELYKETSFDWNSLEPIPNNLFEATKKMELAWNEATRKEYLRLFWLSLAKKIAQEAEKEGGSSGKKG